MNLSQRLSSKNFFIFNLVLLGAIFGFSLAFLSFSCSTPNPSKTARAQNVPGSDVAIPEDALRIAEGLQTAFRAVADRSLASVVEIKTVSIRRQQIPNFNGIPWEFFFGPRDGNREREYRSQGLGSGIIVRRNGQTYYVLTNNHVVGDANEIVVALNDGKEIPAELVGKDDRKDLALVSFNSSEPLPLAQLGDSDWVRVGDWAIAVGNPLGIILGPTGGFIISFPLLALLIGWGADKGRNGMIAGLIAGNIVNYAVGMICFTLSTGKGLDVAFTACVLPFIPTAIVKAVAAGAVGLKIKARVMPVA